ncbi:hypothetical protein [Halopseudomonas sabulinigri]|uniref:hypothetical protein n=1 Tax=Halopseudomonas sabulinigri TaxID=472181 RepID=UPI0012FDF1C8|nr:hypothetical protein [Halopseudomonas sabulinigri]
MNSLVVVFAGRKKAHCLQDAGAKLFFCAEVEQVGKAFLHHSCASADGLARLAMAGRACAGAAVAEIAGSFGWCRGGLVRCCSESEWRRDAGIEFALPANE